ncbi:DNA polymerase-3 subunit epsilon [Micrococcus cohnii]|uniref:DNA polymerase-3 subunit epsilon n=1 Tax=Micrococcus cohnii TaxID=993416 RepID=A0A7W7GNU5_9MICC|nr:3'-5' exonuclease [Micrococcus cohnii]MBB4735549.1 DNA polymerase-3 subunit epsilon [Micrococcus cohnii]
MNWHEQIRAGFDLETTGRDPSQARIVTATIVMVDAAGRAASSAEWLVDPGVPIPDEAAQVHGVSTERARAEGVPAAEGVVQVLETLRDLFSARIPVIAYNAVYDFTVMDREARRHGLEPLRPDRVIDPFVLDKQTDRFRKGKRTLSAVAEHFGVSLENAHTSAADALAGIHVADALARQHEKLRLDPARLHEQQVAWKAEQSASFQEYLRRKDPQATISQAWPVEPVA